MHRLVLLLALAGCATKQARPQEQYAHAFDVCYDSVRARSCSAGTSAERDACMEQTGLRYDGAASRGERRTLLIKAGCPAAVVGSALDR